MNLEHKSKKSKKICITGMHRSGTSLTAMWLDRCGIKLDENEFSRPRKYNKKGFFEDSRVVALQSEVIKNHIPKSKGWIVTKSTDFFFNSRQQREACCIVDSYNNSFDVWGWKDPRTTLFLEHWKQILPDLKVVMVWRSADAVVSSLIRRSMGTSHNEATLNILEAIQSWKIYNQKIIEFCNLFPDDTILMSLESILLHDSQTIDLINSKFNMNLKPVPIAQLYQKELLQNRKSNYLFWYPGIKELAKKLEDKSVHFESEIKNKKSTRQHD